MSNNSDNNCDLISFDGQRLSTLTEVTSVALDSACVPNFVGMLVRHNVGEIDAILGDPAATMAHLRDTLP
jgi:hypothetical protein